AGAAAGIVALAAAVSAAAGIGVCVFFLMRVWAPALDAADRAARAIESGATDIEHLPRAIEEELARRAVALGQTDRQRGQLRTIIDSLNDVVLAVDAK